MEKKSIFKKDKCIYLLININIISFSSFYFLKPNNMRSKTLTLVFDENASFSFYGPPKFFSIWWFWAFFSKFSNFSKQINYIFSLELNIKLYIIR